MVTTKQQEKLDAAAIQKHVLDFGHAPSECLPGCLRPVRVTAKNPLGVVHRQSNLRPGENKGKPFVETWTERKTRRAARNQNGPVTIIQAAYSQVLTPQAQAGAV